MIKDWMQEAANEIAETVRYGDGNEDDFRAAISKHCPMEDGVAYMPVPCCCTCRHWEHEDTTIEGTASCLLKDMSAIIEVGSTGEMIHFQMRTKKDFGCVRWEGR